ncbi:MAG: Rieske 2Fe-2S domain-containing protein [Rhodobacteraceae bacterium]|nr:Rieske 2Fe-2S domain-containing protein [Paracoccaceae bacterium]
MTKHEAKLNALSELSANVAEPFERARAMPRSVYTSEAFLAAELSEIFRKDWFCVTRSDALANPGDYTTLDLAGQPIMVIRDRDGRLRAQSNVCLHRMSTLLEGSGSTRSIVCPYHAWTYNLDGTLRGAPAMSLNEGFCKDAYALPQIRCEEWLGWVMITLNPDAPPVAEALGEVTALIGDFGMEDYRQTFFETHVWDTNWKVLAENFMESYHLPVCHAGTIGGLSKLDEMVCPPGKAAFNYHWIFKDPDFKLANAHPTNTRLKGDRRRMTFLLAIYPSLLITLTPGYFWYLSLHPEGVGQVRIRFGGGMSPHFVNDPDAATHFASVKTLLDAVNVEDRGCTEKVYAGLCSDLARPGHLSHLERPNYDFACYLNARVNG